MHITYNDRIKRRNLKEDTRYISTFTKHSLPEAPEAGGYIYIYIYLVNYGRDLFQALYIEFYLVYTSVTLTSVKVSADSFEK